MRKRLLMDVGNSRVKWVVADRSRLLPGGGIVHAGDPAGALVQAELPPVDEVWVSDVVGGARRAELAGAIRTRFAVEPRFAAVRAEYAGLKCAYAEPSRLGVDRWLMMLAAWGRSGRAACVASVGTALTFDAVDGVGRHRGGCIAPGLVAMQQAVLDTTTFATAGPAETYGDGLGTDTEACVRQGALHAAAGLLDRLATRYGEENDCLLAGGGAEAVLPHLHSRWQHRPALVLEGLLVMALAELGA